MPDLFSKEESRNKRLPFAPLAERIRPKKLEEYVGQDHLTQTGKPLRLMLEHGEINSMIFWGPAWSWKNNACTAHRQSCKSGISSA